MIAYPFNFQPYSSEVKTSSYTIPAGYYAQVMGIEAVNGGITLNSTIVFNATNVHAIYNQTGASTSDETVFSIPASFSGEIIISKFSSSAHLLRLVNQGGNANSYATLSSGGTATWAVRGGDSIQAAYSGSGSSSIYVTLRSNFYPINGSSIWCKAGDVIAPVSSAKFLVTLYPVIT